MTDHKGRESYLVGRKRRNVEQKRNIIGFVINQSVKRLQRNQARLGGCVGKQEGSVRMGEAVGGCMIDGGKQPEQFGSSSGGVHT